MNTISLLGYTFFPLSESGYAGTFQDIMHMIVTIFVVLFSVVSLILFGIGFIKTGRYRYIGVISLITLLMLLIGSILLNIFPKEYFGLAERINVYSIVIYIGILSFWMNKYIRSNGVRTNGI
jgi:phosphatidylserine synthase